MTYKFSASHTFSEEDDYMVLLGFSDDEFEPSKFLIIQRPHKFDEQDVKLGMNKLHIQVEDQSRAHYGGISAISTVEDSLLIELDDSARSKLKVNGDIKIKLNQDHPNLKSTLLKLEEIARQENIPFKK